MKEFPIHAAAKIRPTQPIPFDFVLAHQTQAVRNHGQSVHRLAERGGLDWLELACVVRDRPLFAKDGSLQSMPEDYARRVVMESLLKWKRERNAEETARVGDGVQMMAGDTTSFRKMPTCRD